MADVKNDKSIGEQISGFVSDVSDAAHEQLERAKEMASDALHGNPRQQPEPKPKNSTETGNQESPERAAGLG